MWSSCSAKLRCAGVGLKSYLSSGKSSAIAVNFRPISFQASSTAWEALAAGFTAVSFFSEFCAPAGIIRAATARAAAATHVAIFMVDSPCTKCFGNTGILAANRRHVKEDSKESKGETRRRPGCAELRRDWKPSRIKTWTTLASDPSWAAATSPRPFPGAVASARGELVAVRQEWLSVHARAR